MTETIECVARRRNLLGEGPCWDHRTGKLSWLDIKASKLESVDPDSGAFESIALPVRASAIALRADGGFLVAAEREIGAVDPDGGYRRVMSLPDEPEGNRTNDGNVGADGRFWFGTMDDAETQTSGSVYSLDTDWRLTRQLTHLKIPNALVTDPSGRRLYVADSARGELRIHEIASDGMLGEPTIRTSTLKDSCYPDGAAMDEDGYLWSAQWDGYRIVRYTPDLTVDRIINVPVSRPTSCCFGGSDLRTLFITSATTGMSAEELEAQPLAGSVLALRTEVRGAPVPSFAA